MSTWYHYFKQTKFEVERGSIAFSVTLFCLFAAVAVTILMIRRLKYFEGGELGVLYQVFHSRFLIWR